MNRAVLAGGILPERIGAAGELRRLTGRANLARRSFLQYGDHGSEIAVHQTLGELEAFLVEHPELCYG